MTALARRRSARTGRDLTPAFLFEVKKPPESKGPWDYYNLVATTPGAGISAAERMPLRVHRQGLRPEGSHAGATEDGIANATAQGRRMDRVLTGKALGLPSEALRGRFICTSRGISLRSTNGH